MTLSFILGLSATTSLYYAPAAAADQSNAESVESLDTVTVTGQAEAGIKPYAGGQIASGGRMGMMGDRDFMDTPFNTISYTEQYIKDRQAQDITGVIAATDPSVFNSGVTGENLESYSIRGFSSDIGDVTFDGMFGIAPYYRSSPEMFERIEVLKGPSSLLNGMPPNGSVGGSINLVPKRAQDEPTAQVTGTYMSESQIGAHLDLGRRFGDHNQFGVRFNGVYRDGETSIKRQDKEVQMAALALDWRGENARLSADLYASKDNVDGATRGITLAPGIDLPKVPDADTLLNPEWGFNHSKDKGAMIRGELDISDNLTAYAAVGASDTRFRSTNSSVAQIINAQGDYRNNLGDVGDKADRSSGETGLRSQFQTGGIDHKLVINIKYYKEDYSLNARRGVLNEDWITNLYDPVWAPRDTPYSVQPITDTETRLTSYGIADTLSLADGRFQLTLGARHQNVFQKSAMAATGMTLSRYDESAVTPAAAALFKATETVSLYANYIEGLSQGATAPNTAENAGEIFEPFKTKQYEAGLKIDMGDFAHTLSVYEIKRPSSYTDPVTNIFSSGGEQRNRGAEWSFFGRALDNLRLMGGVAYIDAELTQTADGINQGNQAPGIPKWTGKLGVEWDISALPGLTMTGNATSISKQYVADDNDLALPGRTLYNLGARYAMDLSNHALIWRLDIKNLTDKQYWAAAHYSALAVGAPRTVMLSATMGF
ncbi:ferric anguibactin receptor [Terasakiispira papahanaumokuakeensis]|uniref:Ferric anguibactin receptor n=2 Tax=Terasakiispira papahanaumokuakeensis TaxID=197479 RepID=A0A1E2VDL1_9GAMM|nr:ferric anguibactin receptor [Terasakiispira papahanaumokuakeensis]